MIHKKIGKHPEPLICTNLSLIRIFLTNHLAMPALPANASSSPPSTHHNANCNTRDSDWFKLATIEPRPQRVVNG